VPDPGGGPAELGFEQLEGVFHVEAAQVCTVIHDEDEGVIRGGHVRV
jgi:hypothetical protein